MGFQDAWQLSPKSSVPFRLLLAPAQRWRHEQQHLLQTHSQIHLQLRDFLSKNWGLCTSYSCTEFSFINLSNYLLNPFTIPYPQHPVEGHSTAFHLCAFVLSCQVLVRIKKKRKQIRNLVPLSPLFTFAYAIMICDFFSRPP